jgi:hypothetical protein
VSPLPKTIVALELVQLRINDVVRMLEFLFLKERMVPSQKRALRSCNCCLKFTTMFRKKPSEDGSQTKEKDEKGASLKENLSNLLDQKVQDAKISLLKDLEEKLINSDKVRIFNSAYPILEGATS